MEKAQDSFIIAPTNIVINPIEQLIKFSVKNSSTRSSRYEISVNDFEHYKTISPRTFTLAPGITKYVKIKHIPSEKCCSFPQVIEVVDTVGTRRFVNCRCFSQELMENKKVQMNHLINLEKIKTNQEKVLEIPLKNVGSENLKIKLRYTFDQQLKQKIQFKLQDEQIILLKDGTKNIKASLKLLKEADFEVRVSLQFLQESTREKWQQVIKIKGNSLIKSQYIADSNFNKIQLISQQILNGTTFSGSFYLVNNYHIACPFKLLEVVQVSDYKSYYQRCEEMSVKIENKEGILPPKGQYKIDFLLVTNPNENDKSFTDRYSQLSVKDEANAYKLRNTNFFKKNIDVFFKVHFGQQNTSTFKIKAQVINPALRLSRNSDLCSQYFDIINDSNIEVPFRFIPNLYFLPKFSAGKLKLGANQLQIQWKKQTTVSSKTKQNASSLMKCMVKIQIPKNQLVLYEPSQLLRPKTALLRSGSMSKQNLKERISIRAPSKPGDIGIKTITEVSNQNFSLQPLKYQKGEDFSEEQLKFLQINQSEKGNVITNYHRSKNIVIYLPDKGYLYLENQHSYIIPYERKTLKFQFSGRVFEILSRDFQDKNPYKIINKQIIFAFGQNQKEFEIQQQLQILNKSNEYIMVYCLSTDDDYFHSEEIDHKMLISPKATSSYKISFCPRTEIRAKQNKITRKLQFLIHNQRQSIVCEGQLLSADLQVDEKSIWFKNCIYSTQQVSKKINISNKGLNRINYQVAHSQLIKVTPKSGALQEKSKQTLQISFVPSQLSKQYSQNIVIQLKGSHSVIIPFHVNTLQPEIDFSSNQLQFQQGYLNETLLSSVNITNHNSYICHFIINYEQTDLKCIKNFTILPGETKNVIFSLIVKQAGEKTIRLPYNLIQLQGYGILKGLTQYKFSGKKTLLQLIPENPFQNLVFSQFQEIKPFKIKNISNTIQQIKLLLSPQEIDPRCILSCQPTSATLQVGQQKQFKIVFIRGDTQQSKTENNKLKYQLKLSKKGNEKYRKLDFTLQIPPPGLQILPKQVYFPLTSSGTWSRSTFKILNRGYKEVLIAIKKPSNIAFQIDYRIVGGTNKLTKLKNQIQVEVFFKSKKPISFTVNLDIQDNFSKKYCVKLFGTSSLSPLLNCQRAQSSSSSKLFSSKDINSNSGSFSSSGTLDHFSSEDLDNVKFINKWLNSSLPDFSKDNQNYNIWLRIPKHFMQFLRYLNIDVSFKEESLQSIFQELKKIGYPLYTLKFKLLLDGNLEEWSMCIWYLLSKDFVLEDTLKWVSKLCGINVENYQTAFTHQKKIINDIIFKIFEPIFKGKVAQLQKMLEYLQSSFPILSKIENKRQLILILNVLFNKFGKVHREKILVSKLQYNFSLENKNKCKKNFWIMTNNSFQYVLGEECYHQKYISEKKMLNFLAQCSQNIKIKFKDNINIAVWSNTLSEPLSIYELQINKKAPNVHNITIECENKSTQEWKLNFPCQIQSQYFFDFSGGLQFKCKMPDLGILKAGDIMEFIIVYSPSNLKQHNGILKISNRYEDHIFNLKGKSLQSKYIELEKMIRIPQGQKHLQTFSLLQDPDVCNENSSYKLTILGDPCEEIKFMQAKSNKKEIIIQISIEFEKAIQEKQLYIQICNDDMTYCKNIKLIVSVTPRPLVIQANLRGTIDKVTVEKIPITNPLPTKQNCFISFGKISKDEYDNFSRYLLEKEGRQEDIEIGESEFKISHIGKLSLKPKEKININLSYLPFNLAQSYCQVKIKMDTSQNVIVYNFLGTPELPCTDNPPIFISCQVDHQNIQIIKVSNRLRDKVTFDVQTNIPFIAGPEQITINSRQTYSYAFKMLPLHAGDFTGEIIFKNDKSCLIYPIKIAVNSKRKVRKIRIKSKIRVTSTIEIELFNKAERDIEYDVLCKSEYLKVEPKFLLPSNLLKALCISFTPLFVGTKTAELKLYHENLPQINYQLELISQDSRQNQKINCQLGQKKKFKIPIKNTTSLSCTVHQPKLPKELSIHLSGEHFPISVPAYGIHHLQFVFTQYTLQEQYQFDLQIPTDQIGNYNFSLLFKNCKSKTMPEIIIPYSEYQKQPNIKKQTYIQIFNQFDQCMEFTLPSQTYQINKYSTINLESHPKFQLKAYEKRRIRCDISIDNTQNKRRNSGSNLEEQSPYENQCIMINSKGYTWSYPIYTVKVYESQTNLLIGGSSQELAKTRVSLKNIKNIKNWAIMDLPNYKEHFNLSFISSRQVYLETIFNKPYEYAGHVVFYDESMNSAEKFALTVKIGEKKYEKIWITSNVGDKGKVEIKLKNSKGHYKVQLKNNKMKEFSVSPLEGQFQEKDENIIVFEYSPIQYNGNKKAEVLIQSQYGSFNFYLMGRFPPLK